MTRFTARAAVFLNLLLVAAPVLAQREATVPDPDPEIERKSFEVAEGYEVNLFAGDPLLAKPIQINFDAKGRLWVASSEVYPQIEPGTLANDKILVLEDVDGDGKADSTTVFADGLLIPTGVAPGDGGAYVATSTELLHMKDTNGDGKADTREVVLAGFGTEDTHHIIHTFRWGHEGLLYFNQSIYIHSHVETPWGPRRLGGGGIWQFRPETRQLEVLNRGLVNPWGHQIDAWGQHFETDGAGGEGINFVVPGASYFTAPGAARIIAGLNPGSPKHCGLEIVSGRHMPEDMQGVMVTHDFRAHRVARFQLSDDGSGFASRELPELIKTSHPAFRPVDVVLGPDGALYIADWYNPIIQHGEVDFRDPRRDHTHGRIWRVTAKGRPLVDRPKLTEASVPELLDAMKAPEAWTRRFARLVLKERGAEKVVAPLAAWVAKLDAHDPNLEQYRLEALWTYQALDVPEPALLTALLRSPEPRARAAAVVVVPHWKDRITGPDLTELLAERVADENPRVRLEAVCALRAFPTAKSLTIALGALDRPVDKFLDYALWQTCRELQPVWLPALQAGKLDLIDARKLAFALQAAGSAEVVGPLLDAARAGTLSEAQLPNVFGLVGNLGNPDQLKQAVQLVSGAATPAMARALDALASASANRNIQPANPEALVDAIAAHLKAPAAGAQGSDLGSRLAAVHAAGAWKLEPLRALLEARVQTADEDDTVKLAAIDGLVRLGGPSSVGYLDKLAQSQSAPALRRAAVVGLAGLDAAVGSARAVSALGGGLPADDAAILYTALLARKNGPESLTAALADQPLPRDVAKLGVRMAKAAGQPNPGLVDALTKAGKLDAPQPLPDAAAMAALMADVRSAGNPERGEALFRRADLQCVKCHAVAGAGGKVGPGLESIGASAQVDYLIDSLLQPNKAVKEGYHSQVLATKDGQILTGIVVRKDDQGVTLRDAEGKVFTIAAAQIDDQQPGQSLMPEGLTESLTREEFLDLVRFLSELGKPGAYSVQPGRVVRNWEVLPGTQQTAVSVSRIGFDAMVRGTQPYDAPPVAWVPAYSRTSGDLPLADIPALPNMSAAPSRRWARFGLDVSTGGPIGFQFNSLDGIALWVDGTRVDLNQTPDLKLDLAPGSHTLIVSIDPAQRPAADLRCELVDVPSSPARAQVVVGQ